ncbi:MAG TPA: phosphoglucosamine mutase [Vicinamibacterales bacterium]|nr:phosphoglucosamine mutase [Vicinamibacterales bacterium]
MSTRLFGTDGVRGTAGTYPLDHQTVRRIGAALVRALPSGTPRVLIGRDTRESGEWLERELAHGARACGAEVISAGVIPTPGVAYLTRSSDFTAGVVISASHNPFEDNGIKLFSGGGEKFSEELERHVEAIVADAGWEVPPGEADAVPGETLVKRYLAHVREALPDPGPLAGARIVVDCANGATTSVAPQLFRELGFDVTFLGDAPDGRNINLHCGSTHPEMLARTVREDGFRLGVAFDGDGDRAIFVHEDGGIVDGDAVMLMCARRLQAEGRLKGQAVVATVMSNIGLELGLRAGGIRLIRCQVGDKYVMEELLKRDLSLGGEQSGHIIFTDYLFTGDGLVTALVVLRVMRDTGRSLADLAGDLTTYPQVLVNVRVQRKSDLREVAAIAGVIDRVESRLADRGRLLVRYSGTEPLLRIMLEGPDESEIRTWAGEIAEEVKKHLG